MKEGYEHTQSPEELVANVHSFDELYTVLRVLEPIIGSRGAYTAKEIIIAINHARQGILGSIDMITNAHSIREKVIKLLEEEEQQKIQNAIQS